MGKKCPKIDISPIPQSSTPMPHIHRKRPRRHLDTDQKQMLIDWYVQHLDYPYPTEDKKQDFSEKTDLSLNQINNWFTNTRRRGVGEHPSYSK